MEKEIGTVEIKIFKKENKIHLKLYKYLFNKYVTNIIIKDMKNIGYYDITFMLTSKKKTLPIRYKIFGKNETEGYIVTHYDIKLFLDFGKIGIYKTSNSFFNDITDKYYEIKI